MDKGTETDKKETDRNAPIRYINPAGGLLPSSAQQQQQMQQQQQLLLLLHLDWCCLLRHYRRCGACYSVCLLLLVSFVSRGFAVGDQYVKRETEERRQRGTKRRAQRLWLFVCPHGLVSLFFLLSPFPLRFFSLHFILRFDGRSYRAAAAASRAQQQQQHIQAAAAATAATTVAAALATSASSKGKVEVLQLAENNSSPLLWCTYT